MNPKNLVEAKRVVKGLLKNELHEHHLRSSNIAANTAILQSDRIFCLLQYLDQVQEDLDLLLPETSKNIHWKRHVLLEKTVFENFAEKLESLKKERPVKGTVVFVIQSGEIYMISPYVLLDILEEYPLMVFINGVEYFCFPTIFLHVPEGKRRTQEELEAQHRVALISQINGLKPSMTIDYDMDEDELEEYEKDLYACFFPDRTRKSFTADMQSRYSDLADDDVRNLMIHLLYEMSKNLSEIRKELKSIKKTLKES